MLQDVAGRHLSCHFSFISCGFTKHDGEPFLFCPPFFYRLYFWGWIFCLFFFLAEWRISLGFFFFFFSYV